MKQRAAESAFGIGIDHEIDRLSRYKDPCSSVADLISLKGFQRRQLESYIVSCIQVADRRNPQRLIAEVTEELRADGVVFGTRKKITEALETYCLERMDQGRFDLQKLGSIADKYVGAGLPDEKFSEVLQRGVAMLRREKDARSFSDEYLTAIVAWEVLTNGWELPAAFAQPEEENE